MSHSRLVKHRHFDGPATKPKGHYLKFGNTTQPTMLRGGLLKDKTTQKWNVVHTPMPMEGRGVFCSPWNILGASHWNNVAAFSSATEADGDLF